MSITTERFQWALERLEPAQWRYFERLATTFLAAEFASLRPLASMSGDGGADAMLFEVEDDPTVLVQFSVRQDFTGKINETCVRLKQTHPNARVLIYVANQIIGSASVKLRKNVRDRHGLYLDPRDREWMITIRNSSSATIAEAEELAHKVVDPLVGASGIAIKDQAQALDDLEAKAAFVYLGLQWADDTREKGLTKLCFEAIVRSVLRDTTSDERMTRHQVYDAVTKVLPGHHLSTLEIQVDGALKRLDKRHLRHWRKVDEYCLTWDERVRLAQRIAELSVLDLALRARLRIVLETSLSEMGEGSPEADLLDKHVLFARSVIERVLLERGEAFAAAVARDKGADVAPADIEAVVDTIVARKRFELQLPPHIMAATLQAILINPPDDVRKYLRGLADTYTLFAFMRETPDVQSAVVKMFSDGDIWLDSSFLLPLFAEELLPPDARSHTELVSATNECGLRLYITQGVLEEIVGHMRRSITYEKARSRPEGAHGAAPFLLGAFETSGNNEEAFGAWIDNFYGRDPDIDVMEYLEDVHGIRLQSLTEYVEAASLELRAAVAEVWHESRDYKDKKLSALGVPVMDTGTREKLVSHDVENYVGIIMRREHRSERRSAFGYRSWWLTLDRTAYRVNARLEQDLKSKPPASPAISPDFILNYLAIGPARARLSRRSEEVLPLMVNMSVLDAVPQDLIDLASELRTELVGRPPRVVRRKIRETLEDARRLLGPKAEAGEFGLTEDVKARLKAAALDR